MLNLTDVSRSYGRKQVLESVTVTFPPGLSLLVGPSGAGKSTLLKLLATAERPTRGRLTWDGAPLPGARRALRSELGYAPQAVDLPDELTAREFAMHMAALKGLEAKEADAQFAAITERIGLHPDINNRIATYSGGMRRRLVFAQSLLGTPRLLALDEPTAELDSETAEHLSQLILERAREAIVVMTTHMANALAPHATQVLRVDQGRVRPA